MEMKKLLTMSALLVAFTVLFAGCAPSAGDVADDAPCDFDQQTCDFLQGKDFSGQTLVVGTFGGTIEEILRAVVIPPLEARGATVELLIGGAERVAQVYAERENPTMDIAYMNIFESPQAVADGVVEAPSDEVPAYNDLYPLAQSGCYGMSFMAMGIAYNTDHFDSPPDWPDLWNEENKGKIGMGSYPGQIGEGMYAIAAGLAGADETDPDAAFAKLAELRPIQAYNAPLDETFQLMRDGEIVAQPFISAFTWSFVGGDDNPVNFSWTESPQLMVDNLCIVAGIENRELALAYAQIALSPKTQFEYAAQINFGPTNRTVELPPEVAELVPYGEEQVATFTVPNWVYILDNRAELSERWNKEIIEE
jgi:putative spermidine/putrescine transport system substrate-binding protein